MIFASPFRASEHQPLTRLGSFAERVAKRIELSECPFLRVGLRLKVSQPDTGVARANLLQEPAPSVLTFALQLVELLLLGRFPLPFTLFGSVRVR